MALLTASPGALDSKPSLTLNFALSLTQVALLHAASSGALDEPIAQAEEARRAPLLADLLQYIRSPSPPEHRP